MIPAVPIRILREVLLVIVGAEANLGTEITRLSRRAASISRLSADVDVERIHFMAYLCNSRIL